jgi:hypothetical protein
VAKDSGAAWPLRPASNDEFDKMVINKWNERQVR